MIGVSDEGADLRRRQLSQSQTHEDDLLVAPATTEKGDASVAAGENKDADMDALLCGKDDRSDDDDDDDPRRPNDRQNIAVLLFLYVLQGAICKFFIRSLSIFPYNSYQLKRKYIIIMIVKHPDD